MNEPNQFEQLGKLIDQPVQPDAKFAAELKSQLMVGLTAGGGSSRTGQELVTIPTRSTFSTQLPNVEQHKTAPRSPFRIAAAVLILIGLVVAIAVAMFVDGADQQPSIPAASWQDQALASPARLGATAVPDSEPLWQLPPPEGEELILNGMDLSDGVVYRLQSTTTFAGVEALNATNGAILWEHESYKNPQGYGIIADGQNVYFSSLLAPTTDKMSSVHALSVATGEERWSVDIGGWVVGMEADDGTLYVADDRDTVTAIDAATGSIQWAFESLADGVASETIISPSDAAFPLISESSVVTVTSGGDVVAIDRETGKEQWRSGGFDDISIRLAMVNDIVVVVSLAWKQDAVVTPVATSDPVDPFGSNAAIVNRVSGLSLADGSTRWEVLIAGLNQFPSPNGSTIAFAGLPAVLGTDGPEEPLLARDAAHNMTAIDARNGNVLWTIHADDFNFLSITPWLSPDSAATGFVAQSVSPDKARFVALDGQLQVTLNRLPAPMLMLTEAEITVGMTRDGTLMGFDAGKLISGINEIKATPETIAAADAKQNLELSWRRPQPGGTILDFGGITIHNGTVYRLEKSWDLDGMLAIDAVTGAVRWRHEAKWSGSAGVAADDQGVYFVGVGQSDDDSGSKVVSLSPETGEQRWSHDLNGLIIGLTAESGDLYLLTDQDSIIALDSDDGSIEWEFTASSVAFGDFIPPYRADMPLVSNSTVFTFSMEGDVVAIDRESGEVAWRAGGFDSFSTGLSLAGDNVIVASLVWWDGKNATPAASPEAAQPPLEEMVTPVIRVTALDMDEGAVRWETTIGGPVQQPVVSGGTIALIGMPAELTPDGPADPVRFVDALQQLTGIDSDSGKEQWIIGTADDSYSYSLVAHWNSSEEHEEGFIASKAGGYEFISTDGHAGMISTNESSAYALVDYDGVAVASLLNGTLIGFDPLQLVPKE